MEALKIKTILIPVDFSDSSVNALKYAILLAGKFKSKLILYHSFYSPHASGHLSAKDADQGKKTGTEIALKELSDLFNLSSPAAGQEVDYVCNGHELREELPLLVSERGVDLIVMGTNGIGRLAGKFFGTNTSWTIENIGCPVIAIPEFEVPYKIHHIAYASAYLDSDIINLKTVELIANAFAAEITIVHVANQTAGKETAEAESFEHKLEEAGLGNVRFRTIVSPGVEEALEEYMKQETVDLMVMSAQHHGLYDKLLGKSMTRLMVQHLHRPILFFHQAK
jgi:nucleotide-binding universal stress UspA family protein